MAAVLDHRLYHYYEADVLCRGKVFKIHEAEFKEGLLHLVFNYHHDTNFFLAPTGAQERLMYVRPSVRPSVRS